MASYCEIPPAALPVDKPSPQSTFGNVIPQNTRLESDKTQVSWMREIVRLLQKRST